MDSVNSYPRIKEIHRKGLCLCHAIWPYLYWNVLDNAFEIEYVFAIHSIRWPNFDRLILMNQSSGYGNLRKYGLNAISPKIKYYMLESKMSDNSSEFSLYKS